MRAKDVKVLSVGSLAFSSDSRIGVVQVGRPRLSAEDWNLAILNTSRADDGMYECQVNTRQKINYKVFLTVLSAPPAPGKTASVHSVHSHPHINWSDLSNTAQKDSPYYEVIQPVPLYEQTHSVLKKHHKKINEKGNLNLIMSDY